MLYARALELGYRQGVDIADQRPQAPGYVFYVALASAVRQITHDSNGALVAVSIAASGLAAGAVYLFARRFAKPVPAGVAAISFAAAPLVWTYGEIAMPYALLGLASVAIAAALYASRGSPMGVAGASLALGITAGFRQDLLAVLGLTWIWAAWSVGWRWRIVGLVSLAAGCALWALPSILAAGGIDGYLAALGAQSARVEGLSPLGGGAPELLRNAALTVYGLFWGTVVLGLALVVIGLASSLRIRRTSDTVFFASWIAPAVAFYMLVHVGDPGYVLSVLPAVFVLLAIWLERNARIVPVAAVIGLAQGAFFLGLGGYNLSAEDLAAHDRSVRELVAVTTATSSKSSLVAAQSGYLTAVYYVADRPVRFSGDAPETLARDARAEPAPAARTTVIVFGGGVDLDGVIPTSLSPTRTIQLFTVEAGQPYPIRLYDLGLR